MIQQFLNRSMNIRVSCDLQIVDKGWVKGTVHPRMKSLTSFTHSCSNLQNWLLCIMNDDIKNNQTVSIPIYYYFLSIHWKSMGTMTAQLANIFLNIVFYYCSEDSQSHTQEKRYKSFPYNSNLFYFFKYDMYTLGSYMHLFVLYIPLWYQYGPWVYLLKKYSPSDSFCTFFLWECTGLEWNKAE